MAVAAVVVVPVEVVGVGTLPPAKLDWVGPPPVEGAEALPLAAVVGGPDWGVPVVTVV